MEIDSIRSQMFAFIEAWQSSGQRKAVYCQQHNMAHSKFYYWLKQYKALHADTQKQAGFCEVTVKAIEPAQCQAQVWMTLECADGRRMLFHQPLEFSLIERLLS